MDQTKGVRQMKTYIELDDGTVIATDSPEAWPNDKRISAAKGKKRLKEASKLWLVETVRRGDKVYTVLRHCSRSRMRRLIDLYIIRDNEPQYLTGHVTQFLEYSRHDSGALVVDGAGMDMGFHVVHSLACALFNDGNALKHEWL